jgi:hypothetical protein
VSADQPAAQDLGAKLSCGCYAAHDKDGYLWITAEAFLCEARHKQGDLVEIREGQAK